MSVPASIAARVQIVSGVVVETKAKRLKQTFGRERARKLAIHPARRKGGNANANVERKLVETRSRLRALWQKGAHGFVKSILQSGRLLIEAKDDLKHGQFQAMIRRD